MNKTNELFETMVENQTKAINSFVETTNKFQDALRSGKAMEKSTEIYQDWLNNQVSLWKNTTTEAGNTTENTMHTATTNVEEFYKNIMNTQVDAIKKASEFNMNLMNTFMNFGKNATETQNNYTTMHNNWNTLFESWTKTLNSTYAMLNKTMPTSMNKEVFENMFNTTNLLTKFQEYYTPYMNAWKNGTLNMDSMKNMFDPTYTKKLTEEMFSTFFNGNTWNTLIESNTKMLNDFFANQKNTSKDFQDFWNVYTEKFPTLMNADWTKYTDSYKNMTTSYTELFAPVMKLVSNEKEKESMTLTLDTIDKTTEYSVKLAQLQYHLYTTGQKVSEELSNLMMEKAKNNDWTGTTQTWFNEWIKISEKHFTTLFGTTEFSKLKSELLTLTLTVKKNIEKQFESRIEHLPLVVKSEIEELYETIHQLKKTIKTMETKFNATSTATTTKTTAKKATV
jgi:hypothetical protein